MIDHPILAATLLALGLALCGSVLVAAALLERSGPIRLRHWAEEAGGRLRWLYERPRAFEVFRFLLSSGARLLLLALLAGVAGWLDGLGVRRPWGVALAVVFAVVVVVELANRALVAPHPEPVLRRLTGLYRVIAAVLLPAVVLLRPLFPFRRERDEEEGEVTDEEIEAFIDVGKREGILEPQQEDMVWGVVDFGDTLVKSVMTPRTDLICAPVETRLDELADLFVESKHSRLPLYEGSVDNMVGILHLRDLLAGLRQTPRPGAFALAKPPTFVPETKPLFELLKELQTRHQQLAMVVDEHGAIAGLVTIEDLLEEIVGDIVDEHEDLPPLYEALPDGSWRLDGRAPVDVLDDLFGLDLSQLPFETVGGLVFSALGTLPKNSDTVELHGLRFTVETTDQRRVRTLRVERLEAPEEPVVAAE
jgi:CBS domain containing-hemolysin-like protein